MDEPTFCPTCDSDRTERKMLPDIWWCADCGNTFDGPSGLGHASVDETTAMYGGFTETCNGCGAHMHADLWADHICTDPDEECGWTWPGGDVTCTMPSGHPGPHESWTFRKDPS